MAALRIEVNDHTDVPLAQAHDFAVRAERAGIDGVGVHDHQGSGHDVYVRLALMAQATSSVTLFPSVTNPITRHPAVLAAAAASLAEIAPGRIRMMVGSGDQATSSVGMRSATVAEMRKAVLTLRALLAGESAEHDGHTIRALGHKPEQPPQVYVNASSPRMLACGGEVADGVYAMVGVHRAVVERAREHIADGAARADRLGDDVPIAWGVPVYMGGSREQALEGMRAYAHSNVSKRNKVYARVMSELHPDLMGFEKPADVPLRVLEKLGEALGVVGTPEECGDRLAQVIGEIDASHIVCRIFYAGADAMTALDALIEGVLSRIGGTLRGEH